ncbi:MAG: DUF1593 domain-containing protein, partial [Bacteroidaceae bacterium]|nr:DUF1593 domain-containing protein [Bacteroidaceae bacterium]
MKYRFLLFLILIPLFATLQITAFSKIPKKPRILISTDIGGTDPDDNQSLVHFMMYSDLFNIEGIVSSPSFGNGSKQEILRMIDIYTKDYAKLKRKNPRLLSPKRLKKLCTQGRKGLAPYCGYDKPTEGSKLIVQQAKRKDLRPLYILVWGTLEDVAQALHDAPEIAKNIRIYWLGGPNKKWGVNSYSYVVEHFPDLWFIENNATYRGLISSAKKQDRYNALYYEQVIAKGGNMGTDFINYYGGIVKMGDTPSLLYMMHGDASNPEGESWGGSFERMTFSPRTIYYHGTNKPCEIAPYSVLELRFKGKNLPKENIYKPAFTITIDKQNWEGVYIGNREYSVRYSPKAPTTLDYLTHSDMPELD